MPTASQRLLDVASYANDGATDYRLSKLSGLKQATVSKWRTGTGHMGPSSVITFCALAGIRDVLRWQVDIGCEREQGPDGNVWRSLRDELTLSAKVGKPPRGGMLDSLMRTIAGKAASILVTGFVALGASHDAQALGNKPFSTHYPAVPAAPSLYIM